LSTSRSLLPSDEPRRNGIRIVTSCQSVQTRSDRAIYPLRCFPAPIIPFDKTLLFLQNQFIWTGALEPKAHAMRGGQVDFRAAIFDLDGTLLNTLEDLADSMNRVLERNRLPTHELAAYKYFVGDGIDVLVQRALPFQVAGEHELQRFVQEMKSEYARRWLSRTQPYPGIPELLSAFEAAGVITAVLSNKPGDASQAIVKALLPDAVFKIVVGATPQRPKKPNPSAALEIAARFNIPPQDFLFIGDTPIDMQTACAAGMFPLGVLWGFRTAEELTAAGAKMLVAEAHYLIPWISTSAGRGPGAVRYP
jgi:phosphoglycolate phosphatase